jgi:two-component system, sensor histidine kinase PdtaS
MNINQGNDPDLRKRAEKSFNEQTIESTYIQNKSNVEIETLMYELQVHQIELEMQNDELRNAQILIEDSRQKYFDLYNFAPLGYITISEKNIILEANLRASELLGMERSLLINNRLTNFIVQEDEDIFYMHTKSLQKFKEPLSCELRMLNNKGVEIWVMLESIPVGNIGEVTEQIRISISDITILKEREGQLVTFQENLIQEIEQRKKAEEKVNFQLEEKKLILKETHHRIKNNFLTISSLLNLHAESISNPEAVSALEDAKRRVNSMALLYEKLLLTDDYETTSTKYYLENLIDDITSPLINILHLTLETQIFDFQVEPKLLIPIGIIVNELLTNILKYAFKGRASGRIQVDLKKEDKNIVLIIQDDGIGLPPGFRNSEHEGFGLMLIKMLVEQLHGSFSIENCDGTRNIIKFQV